MDRSETLVQVEIAGHLLERNHAVMVARAGAAFTERKHFAMNELITTANGTTPSLEGFRILIAEDNLVNQKVAMKFLQRWGCQPDVANDGQEAISILEKVPYDLVLMDCHMPVLDGYEATRQIRSHQDSRVSSTPIVAMTANAMKEDKERCLQAGMDDYVSKPINAQTLLECLARWHASKKAA